MKELLAYIKYELEFDMEDKLEHLSDTEFFNTIDKIAVSMADDDEFATRLTNMIVEYGWKLYKEGK